MLCATIDVTPKGIEGWQLRFPDGSYLWKTFRDKSEAIERAKEVAKAADYCLVVRGLDGEVQSRRDFGMRGAIYVA